MTGQEYNGWTNYTTWLTALHLSNDQSHDTDMVNLAKSTTDTTYNPGPWEYTRERVNVLADAIKEYVEELFDLDPLDSMPIFGRDLMNAALGSVNFHEIAQHYADDYPYEADDDTDDDE
jgi:hypothetical protein